VTAKGGIRRERLLASRHFELSRMTAAAPFTVGQADAPAIVVCLAGEGVLADSPMGKGDVLLVPAAAGVCTFTPAGEATVVEIVIPEPHT